MLARECGEGVLWLDFECEGLGEVLNWGRGNQGFFAGDERKNLIYVWGLGFGV